MDDMFDIFEYHYVDKESGLGIVVWARTDEVAKQIIELENADNSILELVPRKRKFKVARTTDRPPYELEQEQLEVAKMHLNKRQDKVRSNGHM